MEKKTIGSMEAGQRLDKFLNKYLKAAPSGFVYKMLRKKNIVLNDRKATGGEKLVEGDQVTLYLSEETVEKFRGEKADYQLQEEIPFTVLYEDEHVCLMNKPLGVLSQKARPEDVSMIEYFTSYLLQKGDVTLEDLNSFHPAVVNRLDRNTSGIIIGGKTLAGLQEASLLLKNRDLHKYYLCVVNGVLKGQRSIKGYLTKSENHNRVTITQEASGDAHYVETQYRALGNNGKQTLLEVLLVTGRSHQIRAHLASIGHPIMGDGKYGRPDVNRDWKRRYGLKSQFLHSYRLEAPKLDGALAGMSGRKIVAPLPESFSYVLRKEGLWECLPGTHED